MGSAVSNAVSGITKGVKNVGKAASGAVGNVQKGVQQFGQGAQQLGSGDLRGLQTMGGSLVNTGSNLYGNMADINRAGIDAAFSPLAGTPLYGLTAGNLKGGIGSLEGVVRGNIAGIQDLPTDIGAGVQQGLDQIGGAAQDLLSGLGNALGGGGGGAGGGVSAPQYYKDLAKKQAEYGMNLPDEFQRYEGERFVEPSQLTSRGEGILGGRYDSRFGEGGTDPFAAANQAVGTAANYQSGFQGTTGGIGGQAGNYQANLANASDPGVFQSRDYTTGLQNFANPNAGVGNVNQGLTANQFGSANQGLQANQYGNATSGVGNVNANARSNQYGNVNQGIQAAQYGNASQGLQGTQNYNRNYQDLVQQSFSPFQDQVVNQTIKDLDRARQIANNEISGSAAKAGAFGGSREALMRAENNRNFFDRVGSAVGQLRSQGFESAANRASQENLQRLGLTASDVQNVRGIQNQGNLQGQSLTADAERQRQALMSQGGLQGQNLTAASDQQANALRSQGALAAQDLQGRGALQGQNLTASAQNQLNSLLSQGNLQGQSLSASDLSNVRNLISQGGLAAQGLQSQGALAALGANADLYSRALGLNSASDLAALQANAGLLSDAMGLDAADLQQRRNLASTEAQFAENALRNAGALNLSGGQALGQLAQAGTADERQRIADMLAAGQAGDMRGQQQADFDYQQFVDETQRFPTQYLNNLQQSGGLAQSLISGPQPQKNPYSGLLSGAGMGLATYGTLAPLIGAGALPAALGMGALGLLGG